MRSALRGCLLALLTCLCLAHASSARADGIPCSLRGTVLVVEEGVQSIATGESDFIDLDLYSVTGLELPSSLRRIGLCAFYGVNARSVTIPEGVESMGSACFQYSPLRSVSLPSTLREVSAATFSDCDGLSDITIAADNPWFKVVDNVLLSKDGATLVYYPAGKRDAHYDVPAGVTSLSNGAFSGNDYLQSVSLPSGLATIGASAFLECGRLASVAVPLTVRTVGKYAFANCVSLARLALPAGASLGEGAFDNCPMLKRTGEPTAAEPAAPLATPAQQRRYPVRKALLNPENARDLAPVYASPELDSQVLGRFACGSYVEVTGRRNGFYEIAFCRERVDAQLTGYVRQELVAFAQPAEALFQIASVRPRDASVRMFDMMCVLPMEGKGRTLPEGRSLRYMDMYGQWCSLKLSCPAWNEQDASAYVADEYASFFISDLLFTRERTDDGKTFGMVTNADPRDRLHLREGPSKSSKSLHKYFSGTQVEILEEAGDWYRVRVDFSEGYMMKDFVTLVPQESEE